MLPRILVAVSHTWLQNTLVQLLRNLPAEAYPVGNSARLFEQLQPDLAAVLVDPFTFGEHSLRLVEQIRCAVSRVPIVALIPADTRDYRDAAVRQGANAVVALDRSDTELLPTMRQLLVRTGLVNGVARRITQVAQASTPVGEAAHRTDVRPLDLKALSERVVERLSPYAEASIAPATPDRIAATQPQIVLHGLTWSAHSPIGPATERRFRTACNLNCGAHFCGLNVTVRDQHIVKIEPADFPDDRYRRVCLKGISYVQQVAHPDRLKQPLKRVGVRGQGEWQPVSWDQALTEISARLRAIGEETGWPSVMFFPYSGQLSALNGLTGVYLRLAAALGASATSVSQFGLDSAVPSGLQDALGAGAGYLANDYTDLVNSKLIVIWGADPAQSRMNWWPFFLEARRAGAKLIAIDPKFGITASKCDEWLPIKPGTDLYLALAMLHVIIERGWFDRDFVTQHTAAPLLVRDDTGEYLRLFDQTDYGVWDEAAQRVVRANEAQSPALSGRYTFKGVTCHTAFDLLKQMVQPYTPEFSAQKTRLSADQILALTEAYATTKPARLFTLYGIDRWHHGATFGRLIATLAAFTGNLGVTGGGAGVDGFAEGTLFDSDFNAPDGRACVAVNAATLADRIITGQPYPIKAVWTAFSNWLNQWPDQNRLRTEVLPKLDLIVTVDQFMTETARWADYVLPAAWLFEREDMVKGPGPYIQYQPPILPPPGECRSDFEIAAGLAQRLGVGGYFSESPAAYLKAILAQTDPALSFDELRAQGVIERKTAPRRLVPHADRVFNTPTGRVEFYVERLLPYRQALPDYVPPIEANPDGELIKRYPLICLTEHSRYRVHSTFGNAPWLRELDHGALAVMHPSVADSRSIHNDDLVRLYNDRGFAVLRARIVQAVPPGTVYLTQGWQSSDFQAGHAQTLTHGQGNPSNALGVNSSFSDVLVDVVKEDRRGDEN
jgi:anaerobic selenocysteine-containing dehydrogenase/DNA-binding NarL/FixJ family response regulator